MFNGRRPNQKNPEQKIGAVSKLRESCRPEWEQGQVWNIHKSGLGISPKQDFPLDELDIAWGS